MPIYEYQAAGDVACEKCQAPFEIFQSMSDEPLATCPACGRPVRRLFSTSAIHGHGSSKQVLSNSNLAEKGFTKYQKTSDGTYTKVTGKGPDLLQK